MTAAGVRPPLRLVHSTPTSFAALLSARDALARADAIVTAAEAVLLMHRAIAAGDDDLADAVEARAVDEVGHGRSRWARVLKLRLNAQGDPDAA